MCSALSGCTPWVHRHPQVTCPALGVETSATGAVCLKQSDVSHRISYNPLLYKAHHLTISPLQNLLLYIYTLYTVYMYTPPTIKLVMDVIGFVGISSHSPHTHTPCQLPTALTKLNLPVRTVNCFTMLHLLLQSPQREPLALCHSQARLEENPHRRRVCHSTGVQCSIHGVQRSRELDFCQGVPDTKRKRPRDEWATEAQARLGRNRENEPPRLAGK